MPNPIILKGWREIKEALGLNCSISTIRRICRQFALPIFYLGNRPCISKENLDKWVTIIESTSNMALEKLEENLLDPSKLENLTFNQKLCLYDMLMRNKYRGLNFLLKLNCRKQLKEITNKIWENEKN